MTLDPSQAAAPAPSRTYFHNNFDYIRLFAATQVLVFHSFIHLHVPQPAWAAIFSPFSGVPMFFVTSGFLITASYDRSATLRAFAESRARRIFPGLWTCIGVTALVVWALDYGVVSLEGGRWLLAQVAALIYTPDFLRPFGFGSYNGSLWTIPVELQFYATVPVLAAILARVRRRRAALLVGLLVAAVAVAIAIRLAVPTVMGMNESEETFGGKLVRYSFVSHYFLFLIGAACYYFSLHLRPVLRGKALIWAALVLLHHWLFPVAAASLVLGQILLALFTISVAYTAVRRNWLHGNDISYGVYLYHGLALNLMVAFGLTGRQHHVLVVLVAAYLAGFASWRLIERRALKRRLVRIARLDEGVPDAPGQRQAVMPPST